MEKIKSIKKIILIILVVLLLVILISLYFKNTEIYSLDLFKEREESSAEDLFFAQKKEVTESENKNSKNQEDNIKFQKEVKKDEIKNVVLISEIKDPFKINKNEKTNKSKKAESSEIKIDEKKDIILNEDLMLLEKNIIAKSIKQPLTTKKLKSKNIKTQPHQQTVKNKKLKLPFRLLGIIKSGNNASALFLYQGQNILKGEKDKIDLFRIEKISKQEVLLSYKNQNQSVKVWKEKNNEN